MQQLFEEVTAHVMVKEGSHNSCKTDRATDTSSSIVPALVLRSARTSAVTSSPSNR